MRPTWSFCASCKYLYEHIWNRRVSQATVSRSVFTFLCWEGTLWMSIRMWREVWRGWREPGSAWYCQAIEQVAMGRNWCIGSSIWSWGRMFLLFKRPCGPFQTYQFFHSMIPYKTQAAKHTEKNWDLTTITTTPTQDKRISLYLPQAIRSRPWFSPSFVMTGTFRRCEHSTYFLHLEWGMFYVLGMCYNHWTKGAL